jgi:spermidine synthase
MVMITEKDEFVYHDMIAHVPANLLSYHGAVPKKALVIGGGDGGTVRELLRVASLEKIVLCEIDSLVVDYCRKYFPGVSSGLDDSRVEVVIGDGVRYLENVREGSFDLVCIDSTDPIGPAEGLFNEAFYRNVKRCLSDFGAVTAQQESYIRNLDFLIKMNNMLQKVFPHVSFYRADIPTYPSGTWCFVIGSKRFDPLSCFNPDFHEKVSFCSRYYNARIHQSAFALPTFVHESIESGNPA